MGGLFSSLFNRPQQERVEKCYSPSDSTLTFAESDDHDFLDESYRSKAARMSCRHSVTPQSLTVWCEQQLSEGKAQFICGHCRAVWPFEEVCKMALLTDEEKKDFERKRFNNILNILPNDCCPNCEYYVQRQDPNNLCVRCSHCTNQNRRAFEFCWQCRREWKGPAPRSDRCGNEKCTNKKLNILATCPEVVFKNVKDVKGCPSVRACPTCGLLIEHNGEKCKNMPCPSCKKEFCFVCLKLTEECSNITNSHFKPCADRVAPRQTSIPVKKTL